MSLNKPLVTIQPTIKRKGFKPKNIEIVLGEGDVAVKDRIDKQIGTDTYDSLCEIDRGIVDDMVHAYDKDSLSKIDYMLSGFELVEAGSIPDEDLLRYLVYRYKYNMFPALKLLDDYPPCLQIEPASICNFRCVFCFQDDKSFSDVGSSHMGYMDFGLFKDVIDQAEGHIESVTMASRGEPTLNKNIGDMLAYCSGKFLAVKLNTNASVLNERLIHAVLSSGIQTIAFSIDDGGKEMYEKLRVNGKFDKVMSNIRMFHDIKSKEYPDSNIVVRISGVKVNNEQNIGSMSETWKKYADIVAFTNYIPWETSYDNPTNEINEPCTELWRRMFVWWDGKVNPCDYDYKSVLSRWNIKSQTLSEIWTSDYYSSLRDMHLQGNRNNIEPCKKCIMV